MSDVIYQPSEWQQRYHDTVRQGIDEVLGAGSAGPGKTLCLTMDIMDQVAVEHERCTDPNHAYPLIWGTSMAPVLVAGGVNLPAWATSNSLQRAGDLFPGGNLDLAALSIWFIGMSFLLLSAIRDPVLRRTPIPRSRGPLPRTDRGPLPLIRVPISRM